MRVPGVLAVLLAAGLAAPASAQLLPQVAPSSPQFAEMLAQQEIARQQIVQQQNQIMALEAQLRTQQALSDVHALTLAPQLPPVDTTPGRPLPHIDTSQLASIPDATLADSNRKVLEAAGNHR
jgi:hypothetical protein